MTWLLEQFVSQVPGVVRALLLSRDGLKLLHSGGEDARDWADTLSAAASGLASMAANVPGPGGEKRLPQQLIVEREDCLLFLQSAGRGTTFPNMPGNARGGVDTVLCVMTDPDAGSGTVGYEMGRLIGQFAPHMRVAARTDIGGGDVR
jgi:predicted regulator of Ras-like GTPase activity (Roadblock/LC7/MglB family)